MTAKIDAAALDALFAPFDHTDAPGFAVGVALKGKSIYRRGFGMASVELPVVPGDRAKQLWQSSNEQWGRQQCS